MVAECRGWAASRAEMKTCGPRATEPTEPEHWVMSGSLPWPRGSNLGEDK